MRMLVNKIWFLMSEMNRGPGYHISLVVLSEDPVLRYQVGTKKMKTSRYQMFLSPGGTEYRVEPVFAA